MRGYERVGLWFAFECSSGFKKMISTLCAVSLVQSETIKSKLSLNLSFIILCNFLEFDILIVWVVTMQ